MNNYEITYLISPELNQEQIEETCKNIVSCIQNQDGVLSEEQIKPVKKILGHSINNQDTAYAGSLIFSAPPEKIGLIMEKLKQNDKILRNMLVSKPLKEKLNFKKTRKKFTRDNSKKQKIELKEIDRKIEEILK